MTHRTVAAARRAVVGRGGERGVIRGVCFLPRLIPEEERRIVSAEDETPAIDR